MAAAARRPMHALLQTTNACSNAPLAISRPTLRDLNPPSTSMLRASANSFSPPSIQSLRLQSSRRFPASVRTSGDLSRLAHGQTKGHSCTLWHASAAMQLAGAAMPRPSTAGRWNSSAGRGVNQQAVSEAIQAIENGDEDVVRQLAQSLSKRGAERLVEELSQQNKVNVVPGNDQRLVTLDDFVNIDRNQDGEFELFIRESEEKKVTEPTREQLWMVAFASSVPFVGFGFMDNAIMILAGEVIEVQLGMAFGITTMAAAAIGNLISDVCGVGLGGTVEVIAMKLGFKQPNLSSEQMQMRSTQLMSNFGAAVGVAFGCFLGMFPLLFMGHKDEEDRKDAAPAP